MNLSEVETMSIMNQVSLVLAVLSIILGIATAILNFRRLREERTWIGSGRDSNRNKVGRKAEDQDSTFPSA